VFLCKRFSDIAEKYVWALNALTGKLNFMKEWKKLMVGYFILIRFQYCGCVVLREIDVL